ncbi:hypothetical protein SSX86_029381 [Deinandra increscens subsp. villosa]|uniref:Uncharacterized protein n=1 Tax=Deinandra increscens subsp. villosa TaxID=3103831 RepID=A0AAP0C9Y8_9ASTR
MVDDNLPPPPVTAKLLQSTSIGKVRLYVTDPAIIKALGNTDIRITIGVADDDIPAMAVNVCFESLIAYRMSSIFESRRDFHGNVCHASRLMS